MPTEPELSYAEKVSGINLLSGAEKLAALRALRASTKSDPTPPNHAESQRI